MQTFEGDTSINDKTIEYWYDVDGHDLYDELRLSLETHARECAAEKIENGDEEGELEYRYRPFGAMEDVGIRGTWRAVR